MTCWNLTWIAASGRTAPGGETRDAFLARARRASERVARELHADTPLLLVSHGGLLNYLLQILLGVPLRDSSWFSSGKRTNSASLPSLRSTT